ncbi:tail assembly chaperone [Staphylococcus pseudintermedius]|uniref:tail assembly chaperone n=1 Tax=Staphylococcus pseudintermedius TaxID=283734 RepID=UPI003F65EE72
MVSVLVDNNEVVLHFGLGELTALDRDLGFEVKEVKLGSGLDFLVPKLESGDVVGLATMLKAATSRQPYPLKTEAQLESALVYAHETYGSFKAFGEIVIEELGKHVLTQDLIKKHQKA